MSLGDPDIRFTSTSVNHLLADLCRVVQGDDGDGVLFELQHFISGDHNLRAPG